MNNVLKGFFAGLVALAIFSCKKESNTFFPNGDAVVLKSSTATIAPAPADSLNTVLVLNWTNPKYSTDSAHQKFIVEMDSSGRNFAKEVTFEVDGPLTDSFTAKQINTALLSWGFAFGVTYPVDVRITSSYANNNEQYTSNVITIQMTPYKIPPKIPVPADLYIVGDGVDLAPGTGWSNPVNAPYQQLTQLDETTFGGIFNMDGGKSFLLLPVNGDWSHKYGGASATGGDLLVDGAVPGSNTPAPSATGWYVIIVNFQTGTYSITPHSSGPSLPDSVSTSGSGLWIIGDATSDQWNNDPNVLGNQQFTRLSNSDFQLTLSLSSSGQYLFLPVAGSWNNKYACASTGSQPPAGGAFGFNASSNFPGPASSGNYLIDVNFITGNYSLTPQ